MLITIATIFVLEVLVGVVPDSVASRRARQKCRRSPVIASEQNVRIYFLLRLDEFALLDCLDRYNIREVLEQVNYREMSPEAQFVMGPRTWLPSEPLRLNLRGHRGKRLYRVRVEVWAHNMLSSQAG